MIFNWTRTTITTNKQANDCFELFRKIAPDVTGFDTETTGLQILHDKPFVFQFGFVDVANKQGYTYAVDIEKRPKLARTVIRCWQLHAESCKKVFGHNAKFDLHMSANMGLPYTKDNLSDTQFYIRYAHDALQLKEGGPSLALKDYAFKYVDRKAKQHEQLLKKEQTEMAKNFNLMLKRRLATCKLPDKLKTKYKSFTLSALLTLFKDATLEINELSAEIQKAYTEWKTMDLPVWIQAHVKTLVESNMIRYNRLNRENLIRYAHLDIVYMLEIYYLLEPVIRARQQEYAIELEESLILPLWEMERIGFEADADYLEESRVRVKQYIRERRARLYEITQQNFNIGQHAVVKELLVNDFDLEIASTNAAILSQTLNALIRTTPDDPAIEVIQIVQELRTLEKWYSVYIMRFINELTDSTRLYTQINQVGAVSGRVTSSFQQFPRDPIETHDGKELFHPRKIIKAPTGEYQGIVFLDYSQIELRFQAFYTILVGYPDLNLCRAYMPYKCFRYVPLTDDKIYFNYKNPEHIKTYQQFDWFLEEDETSKWHPTDVHGVTTTEATGLKPEDEGFKHARSTIGKRTNFAKNYGAQLGKIKEMFPDKTDEECIRINEAYYKAFPGIKKYHNYCYNRANESNTVNLFGIRYYNVSGHKLINMLIQGSAAFYLKRKIREVYDYSKKHNIKSRFQMNIHDELSWERHHTEDVVFFKFQKIMQDWEDTFVPIIAEMEATMETWADKKGVKTLEEFQIYFGN